MVFIRSEEDEWKEKFFGGKFGYKKGKSIVRLLNQRVQTISKQSKLPTFVIAGKEQVGETFGQRLSNAVQSVFDLGFTNVIALGNDCLQLKPHTIRKAVQTLNRGQSVIGPTPDGGVYLLGIRRDDFNAETFAQLPWQTEKVFAALQDYFIQKQLLSHHSDLNTFEQFYALISIKDKWLIAFLNKLNALFAFAAATNNVFFINKTLHLATANARRGPPFNI